MTSSSSTSSTIHSLPLELLRPILLSAVTPTLLLSSSLNAADEAKLAQQSQRISFHLNTTLVCQFWRSALGPQTTYLAVGKRMLMRLLGVLVTRLIDGEAVRRLELESFAEGEYKHDEVMAEKGERESLMAKIVDCCPNLEELRLHLLDGAHCGGLVESFRRLERLKSIALVNDSDLVLLMGVGTMPTLSSLHVRRLAASNLQLSLLPRPWFQTSLTSLTFTILRFPYDLSIFTDILSASYETLSTLKILEGRFYTAEGYDNFNTSLEPVRSRLRTLWCTRIMKPSPTSVTPSSKEFLNLTLNNIPSIVNLSLHSKTFTSCSFLSLCPHLQFLSLEWAPGRSNWSLVDLIQSIQTLHQSIQVDVLVDGKKEWARDLFEYEAGRTGLTFEEVGLFWENLEVWVSWLDYEDDEVCEYDRSKMFLVAIAEEEDAEGSIIL